MLSGPELSRIVKQFEDDYLRPSEDRDVFLHHESGLSSQKKFTQHVNSLTEVVKKMGNPFLDNFPELVAVDTRDCTDPSVIVSLQNLEETGKKQYNQYVEDVLIKGTKSIHDTIKKNNLSLFKQPCKSKPSKQGKKIAALKDDVSLFSQMYIALQNRNGDIREFFCHEIHKYPPSISEYGKLRLPNSKSDLLKCLPQTDATSPSHYDCKILDGAVIVHSLPITDASTFDEYAERVFIPHILRQLVESKRVDIVWDEYRPGSLKESTREKRGKGLRRKVAGQTRIPSKWLEFLRDPLNKSELFAFLTSKVEEHPWPIDSTVVITSGNHIITSYSISDHAQNNCIAACLSHSATLC